MVRARRWGVGVAAGLVLGGCSSFTDAWNEWTGGAAAVPPTIAATSSDVFYAGYEGLTLHELPSGASPIVARLALHQRLTRVNQSRGYAQVRTDAGLEGWVDTAELLWKLPSTPEPVAPAVAETPAQVPTAAPIPETPAWTPEPPTPIATAPTAVVETPVAVPPAAETPVEVAPTEAAAPVETPAAAVQPTKAKRGLRSLFP